jgi:hypothetical protein
MYSEWQDSDRTETWVLSAKWLSEEMSTRRAVAVEIAQANRNATEGKWK